MTVILIVAIIFISVQLTNQDVNQATIAPKKTKAQATDYSKLIAVNARPDASNVSPTITPTPIVTISPTSNLLANNRTSPTIVISPTISPIISTPSASITASISATINPSKPASLPRTGIVSNSIFIFGAASLLVFFSLIL